MIPYIIGVVLLVYILTWFFRGGWRLVGYMLFLIILKICFFAVVCLWLACAFFSVVFCLCAFATGGDPNAIFLFLLSTAFTILVPRMCHRLYRRPWFKKFIDSEFG